MTVGAAAIKLLEKGDQGQSVIDTQREMQKGYMDELIKCAKRYDWQKPFYVCVQTKKERLLQNVIRSYFYARQTRPYPQYDLALYYYDPATEQLEFVWCIPDKETVDSKYDEYKAGTVLLEESKLVAFCVAFKENRLV